jgi:hypothetical protein
MWAKMASSNKWKERERKSTMVLDVPGTGMTQTFNSALREMEPRWQRRKATGAMEEVEPRDAQETAGVLLQPIHRVELHRGWEVERAWVWATTPRSSRSELVMEPVGLCEDMRASWMSVGKGWCHMSGSEEAGLRRWGTKCCPFQLWMRRRYQCNGAP